MINSFWQWLSVSSANPEETALTVKGIVGAWVPMLMFFVHSPSLNTLPDDVYSIVLALFACYTGVALVFGFIRKIRLTLISQ